MKRDAAITVLVFLALSLVVLTMLDIAAGWAVGLRLQDTRFSQACSAPPPFEVNYSLLHERMRSCAEENRALRDLLRQSSVPEDDIERRLDEQFRQNRASSET